MSKREKIILGIFALALVVSLLALMLVQESESAQPESWRVSVLLDGSGEAAWRSFRRGADAAAVDYNVDLRYVTGNDTAGPQAQLEALSSELDGGAQGIVAVPVDLEALTEYLTVTPVSQPVIVAGMGAYDEHISGCIEVDNQAMGALLAQTMADAEVKRCCIYLRAGYGELERQRLQGLTQALEEAGISSWVEVLGEETVLQWTRGTAMVGMDPETLTALARRLPQDAWLYGMGVSSSVLELLESGQVQALAAVSEYDLGYLSLAIAAGLLTGDYLPNQVLTPFVVDREIMFQEPYAQYLVPMG